MAIEAGDILFRITGSSDELRKALDDAGVSISGASKAMIGLGAAITGALSGTVYLWTSVGGAISDFSSKTGIAAEDVSVLRYALEQSGSSLDAMGSSLLVLAKNMEDAKGSTSGLGEQIAAGEASIGQYKTATSDLKTEMIAAKTEIASMEAEQDNLNKQIEIAERQYRQYGEASGFTAQQIAAATQESIALGNSQENLERWLASAGNEMGKYTAAQSELKESLGGLKEKTSETADNLERIGLSYEKLAALTPNEQFLAVGFALSSMADPMERAAVGSQLLGKAYTQLIPLFAGGATGMAEFTAQAESLGIIMSADEAEKAKQFGDTINMIKEAFMGLAISLGPVISDMVTQYTPAIIAAVRELRLFIDAHPELIENMIKAAAAMAGLSTGSGLLLQALGPVSSMATIIAGVLASLQFAGYGAAGGVAAVGAAAEITAGVAGGGGLLALAGALAGPVGVAAAAGVLIIELGLLAEAFTATNRVQGEAHEASKKSDKAMMSYAESLKGTWKEIDTATLKGLDYDEGMKVINEHVDAARIAGGHYGDSVRETGAALDSTTSSGASAADILQALANNSEAGAAAMITNTNAVWGMVDALIALNSQPVPQMPGGGGFGPPGMGGGIMFRGASIPPLPSPGASTGGGGAAGGGGGPQITINVTGNSIRSETDIAELSSRIARDLSSSLRGRGFGLAT